MAFAAAARGHAFTGYLGLVGIPKTHKTCIHFAVLEQNYHNVAVFCTFPVKVCKAG
jgi:hypothetical protein